MDLRKALHPTDPYQDFDYTKYPYDPHDIWGGQNPYFGQIIRELRPHLVIEVGSWKGGSAIAMAKTAKAAGLPMQIVCVDTWLGALEFWTDKADNNHYPGLKLVNGYPSVYYQFLANVLWAGVEDYIIPFPQTSTIASLYFHWAGAIADLIYIDASHEENFVFEDISNYWKLLSNTGVMFGDDFMLIDSVKRAVRRFTEENGLQYTTPGVFWRINGRER